MIISASRRTDIPAFFADWFINRVKEGYVLNKNPFNANQIKKISLKAFDVDAIVFWTRNPKPLMKHLHELDSRELNYYFQYTITGYPKSIEKNVPNTYKAIETFTELSEKIGKEKVIWRYDPIILTDILDIDEHLRLFEKIATSLENKTEKVVVSFADPYKKIQKKLENMQYKDILESHSKLFKLAQDFSDIARAKNLKIESCSEAVELKEYGIEHGKCIDDDLLRRLFNYNLDAKKDKNQRKECGCVTSIDIGMYNTCSHGCEYCYATFSDTSVKNNLDIHNPNSPLLVGEIDEQKLKEIIGQQSLF